MAYVASQFVAQDEATTPGFIIIPVPTHTDGDLLLMFLASDQGTAPSPTPTGWTQISQFLVQAGVYEGNWYYRVANSEPATYTATWGSASSLGIGAIVSWSDVSVTGTPVTTRTTQTANDSSGHANEDFSLGSNPIANTVVFYASILGIQSNRMRSVVWTPDASITTIGNIDCTNSLSTPPDNIRGSMYLGYTEVSSAAGEPAEATDLDWAQTGGVLFRTSSGLAQMFDIAMNEVATDVWKWAMVT